MTSEPYLTPEQIREVAAKMRDPEAVVLNPRHYWEDEDGNTTDREDQACRACVFGHADLITGDARPVGGLNGVALAFTREDIDASTAAVALERLADLMESTDEAARTMYRIETLLPASSER